MANLSPLFCIMLWIFLGYSMILFNKAILSSWNFGYPFFLTAWHTLFATILTQILSRTTNMLPGVNEGKVSLSVFAKRIFPMSLCFACGLAMGNSAYKYLSVAYIQMLKSMTPIPLLLVAFAIGRETPSALQLGIVVVISFGVAMSSFGELNFSLLGFSFQLAAIASDVARMTLLDSFLVDIKLDSMSTLYYMAPCSAVLIGLGFCVWELPTFPVDRLTTEFCWVLLANAALSFSLNWAVIALVNHTSAMTMSLAGLLKDCMIVLSSVVIFQAPVTRLQLIGYSISLAALNVYREFKTDPVATRRGLLFVWDLLGDVCLCRLQQLRHKVDVLSEIVTTWCRQTSNNSTSSSSTSNSNSKDSNNINAGSTGMSDEIQALLSMYKEDESSRRAPVTSEDSSDDAIFGNEAGAAALRLNNDDNDSSTGDVFNSSNSNLTAGLHFLEMFDIEEGPTSPLRKE